MEEMEEMEEEDDMKPGSADGSSAGVQRQVGAPPPSLSKAKTLNDAKHENPEAAARAARAAAQKRAQDQALAGAGAAAGLAPPPPPPPPPPAVAVAAAAATPAGPPAGPPPAPPPPAGPPPPPPPPAVAVAAAAATPAGPPAGPPPPPAVAVAAAAATPAGPAPVGAAGGADHNTIPSDFNETCKTLFAELHIISAMPDNEKTTLLNTRSELRKLIPEYVSNQESNEELDDNEIRALNELTTTKDKPKNIGDAIWNALKHNHEKLIEIKNEKEKDYLAGKQKTDDDVEYNPKAKPPTYRAKLGDKEGSAKIVHKHIANGGGHPMRLIAGTKTGVFGKLENRIDPKSLESGIRALAESGCDQANLYGMQNVTMDGKEKQNAVPLTNDLFYNNGGQSKGTNTSKRDGIRAVLRSNWAVGQSFNHRQTLEKMTDADLKKLSGKTPEASLEKGERKKIIDAQVVNLTLKSIDEKKLDNSNATGKDRTGFAPPKTGTNNEKKQQELASQKEQVKKDYLAAIGQNVEQTLNWTGQIASADLKRAEGNFANLTPLEKDSFNQGFMGNGGVYDLGRTPDPKNFTPDSKNLRASAALKAKFSTNNVKRFDSKDLSPQAQYPAVLAGAELQKAPAQQALSGGADIPPLDQSADDMIKQLLESQAERNDQHKKANSIFRTHKIDPPQKPPALSKANALGQKMGVLLFAKQWLAEKNRPLKDDKIIDFTDPANGDLIENVRKNNKGPAKVFFEKYNPNIDSVVGGGDQLVTNDQTVSDLNTAHKALRSELDHFSDPTSKDRDPSDALMRKEACFIKDDITGGSRMMTTEELDSQIEAVNKESGQFESDAERNEFKSGMTSGMKGMATKFQKTMDVSIDKLAKSGATALEAIKGLGKTIMETISGKAEGAQKEQENKIEQSKTGAAKGPASGAPTPNGPS
jgi:hypothetical protein